MELTMGCISPPIPVQLDAQHIKYDAQTVVE